MVAAVDPGFVGKCGGPVKVNIKNIPHCLETKTLATMSKAEIDAI